MKVTKSDEAFWAIIVSSFFGMKNTLLSMELWKLETNFIKQLTNLAVSNNSHSLMFKLYWALHSSASTCFVIFFSRCDQTI